MAENSKIEWTDHTANFWWGCFKVSPGCQHCYAETLSNRFSPGNWGPARTTNREYKRAAWKDIPRWNRQAQKDGQRKRVFVMSMGDFFEDHPQVEGWRWDAMGIMEASTMIDFQVLTKRPESVLSMVPDEWRLEHWPAHIWIGTSVENQQTADERIPELLQIPAAVRFLSIEPLLGPVNIETFIYDEMPVPWQVIRGHWVIVGGESGPNARPMHPDWARSLRDQCVAAGVPFFFKQWGEFAPLVDNSGTIVGLTRAGKKAAGRQLDGREWNEMPNQRHV